MKVGDLVTRELSYDGIESITHIGLIIEEDNTAPFPNDIHYKVMWSGNYGTFWTPEKRLERFRE